MQKKIRLPLKKTLCLLGLGASLAYLASVTVARADLPDNLKVIDGDTYGIGKKRYRIVGYDAPEIFKPGCDAEAIRGAEAKLYLHSLLHSPYATAVRQRQRDLYGRTLVRVYLNGSDISKTMIFNKYGLPYKGKKRPNWCVHLKYIEGKE
jgi:micrococcal nuclease